MTSKYAIQMTAMAAISAISAICHGCGDALLDDTYRGEPLFTYSGQLATDGAQPRYDHPLRTGIFWLPYDPINQSAGTESTIIEDFGRIEGIAADAALVEQASIAVQVRFPGLFEINVFAPPPAAAVAHAAGLRYGVMLLYEDRDGDGRMGEGERVGGGTSQLVVFTEHALGEDAPDNPLDHALPAGYAVLDLPLRCGDPAPEYPLDEALGARVGAACSGPVDTAACGPAGRCLQEDLDGPLPGGYCVLDEAAVAVGEDGQPPSGLVLVETERGDDELKAWYRACSASVDCREGYTCQQHVCLPDGASSLVLDRAFEIEATCARDHELERREAG